MSIKIASFRAAFGVCVLLQNFARWGSDQRNGGRHGGPWTPLRGPKHNSVNTISEAFQHLKHILDGQWKKGAFRGQVALSGARNRLPKNLLLLTTRLSVRSQETATHLSRKRHKPKNAQPHQLLAHVSKMITIRCRRESN